MPTVSKLTWEEYRKRLLAGLQSGKYKGPADAKSDLGIPKWEGTEWKVETVRDKRGRLVGLKRKSRDVRKANRAAATAKRNKFDVTSTDTAAAERARFEAESRQINAEAKMYGLKGTRNEHKANQLNARNITAGAPGDPDRLLRVTESDAFLKDNVETAVKKHKGGVYNNPAQEAITVVDSKYYDDLADPNSIPESIHIKDQAALRRFRTNLARHPTLSSYLQMAAKKGIKFAGFVNPFMAMAPELIEIADNYTDGAVSEMEEKGYQTAKDFVVDKGKKAINNANGIVQQFIDAYASLKPSRGLSNTDFGQYEFGE